VEVVALGSVDIFIRSGHGVDPYFHFSMFGPPDGWWKVWFFLRNDTNVLLPVFTGSRLSPNLTGGTAWPRGTFASYNPWVTSSSSCCEDG
jgi:hypothetical protein